MDGTSHCNPHSPHCGQAAWRPQLDDLAWHRLSRLKRTPEQHDFYKCEVLGPTKVRLNCPTLLLHLPALSNLHPPPPAYVWRFKVRETYYQNGKQVTRQVGSQDCPLFGCQTQIQMAVDIQSVSNTG